MSDNKAPERVWLIPTEGWGFIQTQEKPVESLSISIEYVRADLASRSAGPEERCQHLTERDELGEAIAQAAIKARIIDGSQPLNGPQLVMLCHDLATSASRSAAPLSADGHQVLREAISLLHAGHASSPFTHCKQSLCVEAAAILSTPAGVNARGNSPLRRENRMGTTLNRHAYQRMIDEDLAWLDKQPRTLEREHIKDIVRLSPGREYGSVNPVPATADDDDELDALLLRAYHHGVDDAKDAIRTTGSEKWEGSEFKPFFINQIARTCGTPSTPAEVPVPSCNFCGNSTSGLIPAAKGFICKECLAICKEIVAPAVVSGGEAEVVRRDDLINHMRVHSGYPNCGYMQMTTEQKQLYDAVWAKEVAAMDAAQYVDDSINYMNLPEGVRLDD